MKQNTKNIETDEELPLLLHPTASFNLLAGNTLLYKRSLSSIEKALQPLVDQHEAVVDAIEQRDSAKAESAIRFHLREVLRDLPVLVSQQPEIFTGDGELS